jgi:Domain of unknown function (DUF4383)
MAGHGERRGNSAGRAAEVGVLGLAPVQWAAILGALTILVWSVPGLILNPHFAVGDAATAERVLGSDMNGWHAVSGFLVALPALAILPNARLTALYIVAAAGSLIATAIWALLSTRPAGGLFYFPHNESDAILHFGTAAIFLAGAAHYYRSSTNRTSASSSSALIRRAKSSGIMSAE